METTNNIERRKYARLVLRTRIDFTIVESETGKSSPDRFRGTGKNIGAEGILFSCDKDLKPGTVLDLEIFLPDKPDPVYIQGDVRWCAPASEKSQPGKSEDGFDVGVKFRTINKNNVILLVQYVCGNLQDELVRKLDDPSPDE